MKRSILILAFLPIMMACTSKKIVVTKPHFQRSEINFGFAKDSLSYLESEKLTSVLDQIKSETSNIFVIEGHTDPIGDKNYNLELGDRRARQVKHYLVSQGIPADRLIVVTYGESMLVSKINRLNRRAVIRIANQNGDKDE